MKQITAYIKVFYSNNWIKVEMHACASVDQIFFLKHFLNGHSSVVLREKSE